MDEAGVRGSDVNLEVEAWELQSTRATGDVLAVVAEGNIAVGAAGGAVVGKD